MDPAAFLDDPFAIIPPARRPETVTVKDEKLGKTWSFEMEALNSISLYKSNGMAAVLKTRYITGSEVDGTPSLPFPPMPPDADGKPTEVELSEDLFEQVAQLWAMQTHSGQVPGAFDIDVRKPGIFTPEQFVALAVVSPTRAWHQLLTKCAALAKKSGND
jgi:hypothetical protein